MSLLLEALKKAELAKQGKKPSDEEPAALALELEPVPARADVEPDVRPFAQPVITRQELPDITQPLEILSEDLPSAAAMRAAAAAAPEPVDETPRERPVRGAPSGVSAAREATQSASDAAASADREAARQIFEAKEVEYNPKRNFYITIGVLVAAGAGYGGYVWWQLQPKAVYNTAAVQDAGKAPRPAPASQAQEPAAPPAPAQAPPAPAPTAAAPAGAAKPAAAPVAEPQPAAPKGPLFAKRETAPARPAGPAAAAAARSADKARAEPSSVSVTPSTLTVDPLVERGFGAYQRGDLAGAREAYQLALQRDPLNRDALLGLAAIDLRTRSYGAAQPRYLKLLELDPRDVDALAGLMSLRGHADPAQSESRLKTLIAASPDSASLHFALGNLYAQQALWTEAQSAFFKAYSGDPENPDFAFNLAISLDQLRQRAPAMQYYRRAIELAATRPVSFDLTQAHARIQELQQP